MVRHRMVDVGHGVAVERVLVARSGAVDEMLDDGRVGEGERGQGEADRDALHGLELEACPAHERVDHAVHCERESADQRCRDMSCGKSRG